MILHGPIFFCIWGEVGFSKLWRNKLKFLFFLLFFCVLITWVCFVLLPSLTAHGTFSIPWHWPQLCRLGFLKALWAVRFFWACRLVMVILCIWDLPLVLFFVLGFLSFLFCFDHNLLVLTSCLLYSAFLKAVFFVKVEHFSLSCVTHCFWNLLMWLEAECIELFQLYGCRVKDELHISF